MIRLDEVEVISAEDQAKIARIEEIIDAELKKTRGGIVRMRMGKSVPNQPQMKVDERVWAAVIRRYLDAGWIVEVEPPGGPNEINGAFNGLCVFHPQLAMPESMRQFLG